MNAMSPPIPLIPDNAPFTPAQRAWLNGFLAGLYGGGGVSVASAGALSAAEPEDFPWHDAAMELDGADATCRGSAAEAAADGGDGTTRLRSMADTCGQSYAEALADGREASTSLCIPGAKPTARLVKQLMTEVQAFAVPKPAAAPSKPHRRRRTCDLFGAADSTRVQQGRASRRHRSGRVRARLRAG